MPKSNLIDIISQLEQFETHVTNLTPIFASYYAALKKNGVPDKLAYDLVRDFHRILWNKLIPDGNPPSPQRGEGGGEG